MIHAEVDEVKAKLDLLVSTLLLALKYDLDVDELDDGLILSYLYIVYTPDEISLHISDKKIVVSIKEYLYHLFDEVGGIKALKNVDMIVFAGSIDLPARNILLSLDRPKPNHMNVLLGV